MNIYIWTNAPVPDYPNYCLFNSIIRAESEDRANTLLHEILIEKQLRSLKHKPHTVPSCDFVFVLADLYKSESVDWFDYIESS